MFDKLVSGLNNRTLVAVVTGLFVLGIVRGIVRR